MIQRQRLLRLIIIAAVLGVLALLVFIVSSKRSGVTIRSSYKVPSIFAAVAPYDDNSLIMTNERAFVAYNYHTGNTTQISPDSTDLNLQSVDSILPTVNKRYVIFHNQLANPGGALGALLQQDGSDVYASYWWVYDTTDNTYHHFDSNVSQVRTDGTNVYALGRDNDTQAIITYSLANFTKTSAIPVTDASNFFVAADGFLLNASGDKVMSTKDGVVNKGLFDNATVTGVFSDKRHAVATLSGSDARIAILDLQNKTQKTIASNTGGAIMVNQNTVLFSSTGNPDAPKPQYKLYTYNLDTGKVASFGVPKELSKTSLTPKALLNNTYVATGDNQEYLLSSDHIATLKGVPSNYNKSVSVGGNDVTIPYYSDQKAFLITLDASNAQDEEKAVYKQLRGDGYNPLLLDLRFSIFSPPAVNDADVAPLPPPDQ